MAKARVAIFVSAVALGCGSTDREPDSSGGDAGPSTSEPGTSSDTTSASSDVSSGAEESSGGEAKFDVGGETEGDDCECGSQLGFSYIWIANSDESTVTKLNTQTLVEEGRYLTRADGDGNPSRTSVALSGRAVAIANRNGGVAKVWATPSLCDPDTNGVAGLQTSTGPGDVLPFGEDDCLAWHTDFDYTTQRPIAWVAGQFDPRSCDYVDEKLWTAGCKFGTDGNIRAHRLDGNSGAIEDSVTVTGFACSTFGGYGGAVDADGNFWISESGDLLARIDGGSLAVDVWTTPPGFAAYGITIDHAGRPWVTSSDGSAGASAARFDPVSQTWALATDAIAGGQSGIQEDADGRMWMNYWYWNDKANAVSGVVWIDVDTMAVAPRIDIPGIASKGLSIDLDGNVWTISLGTDQAIRFDPDTQQLDSYDGLSNPYTYSDMTGWALQNAACAPEG